MIEKYYTIVKIDFEYNDEIYHSTEEGGGNPVLVYKNLLKAEEKCEELNNKYILDLVNGSGGELSDYGYDWEEIIDTDVIETLSITEDLYDFSKNGYKNLSDEQKQQFIDGLTIRFFKVVEVLPGD